MVTATGGIPPGTGAPTLTTPPNVLKFPPPNMLVVLWLLPTTLWLWWSAAQLAREPANVMPDVVDEGRAAARGEDPTRLARRRKKVMRRPSVPSRSFV